MRIFLGLGIPPMPQVLFTQRQFMIDGGFMLLTASRQWMGQTAYINEG